MFDNVNFDAQNRWERLSAWFHRYPTWVVSGSCFVLFLALILLYFVPGTPLHHVEPVSHFSAVFLELCLAILFIEEIIKPKMENAEVRRVKRAKKQSFLRNLLRHDLDLMMVDYVKEYEALSQNLGPIGHLKTKAQTNKARMRYVQQRRNFFTYFDTLRPFHGNVAESTEEEENQHGGLMGAFLHSWEELLSEAIENVRLVNSKPQYTQFRSWDLLIDWYVELKRHNHEISYLKQDLTDEQDKIKLYFAGLKALSTFLLDLEYFGLQDEMKVSKEYLKLAKKVYSVWGGA